MKKINRASFALYAFLLMFSYFFWAVIWDLVISGKLFHQSDPIPILDFFPPFVIQSDGDYYIISKLVVYIIWLVFLAAALLTPLLIVQGFNHERRLLK